MSAASNLLPISVPSARNHLAAASSEQENSALLDFREMLRLGLQKAEAGAESALAQLETTDATQMQIEMEAGLTLSAEWTQQGGAQRPLDWNTDSEAAYFTLSVANNQVMSGSELPLAGQELPSELSGASAGLQSLNVVNDVEFANAAQAGNSAMAAAKSQSSIDIQSLSGRPATDSGSQAGLASVPAHGILGDASASLVKQFTQDLAVQFTTITDSDGETADQAVALVTLPAGQTLYRSIIDQQTAIELNLRNKSSVLTNPQDPAGQVRSEVVTPSVAIEYRQMLMAPGQIQNFVEQLGVSTTAAVIDSAGNQQSSPAVQAATATGVDELQSTVAQRQEPVAQQITARAPAAMGMPFAPAFTQTLSHAFDSPQWGDSFAKHIALLSGQKISSAHIQLDPPEMGSLMVRINISGDQASVSFVSQNVAVRDAIEQNLDRLQNLLSEQGLELLDANVSDQSFSEQDSKTLASGSEQNADAEEADIVNGALTLATRTVGLIDYYA